jgi:hypothetical protein
MNSKQQADSEVGNINFNFTIRTLKISMGRRVYIYMIKEFGLVS